MEWAQKFLRAFLIINGLCACGLQKSGKSCRNVRNIMMLWLFWAANLRPKLYEMWSNQTTAKWSKAWRSPVLWTQNCGSICQVMSPLKTARQFPYPSRGKNKCGADTAPTGKKNCRFAPRRLSRTVQTASLISCSDLRILYLNLHFYPFWPIPTCSSILGKFILRIFGTCIYSYV